ncbi:NACHT domain-containing protein [Agrobacterium vaccinii]|uniref:NACHT domain-containing protein n=1 Tax=Agrobacterium vaccinii TaxID=2735528 RepID=UPI001E2BD77F|nr:NACHT domain-containing protein [Agrobacterium vaccinii]UHS56851.1 NACHT domain-containing protein [Agrobacterium vaccinii]
MSADASSSFDNNAIVGTALADLIKASFNSVSAKAASKMKTAWSMVFEDFEPFMRDNYQKNKYIRLLSQKEKDVELYSVYVGSNFKCSTEKVSDDELILRIRDGSNVIINGNGGAGKTFFMRHLWLTFFQTDYGKTPVFIELRKLNELSTLDLLAFVRRTISRKKELDDSLFRYFCDQGRFCFILDGYDEVLHSQREALQSQVLELSSLFPECRFIVSSRYENRFAGWQNFDLYESMPFDLTQVQQLVSKIPFDEGSRTLFKKQLTQQFYRENFSFLSNPLLAIMMMMTFKENMDIPRRMSIFYDQAFTTLYQWHDATKAFNRLKCLAIDDFQRSFAAFSLLTYYKEKFEFSKSETVKYIKKSNEICRISADPEKILLDYEESVNLLKQDGLEYVFIHRSFQEYFAAYAMVHLMPEKFSDLLPNIRKRSTDSVLKMCFEMNRGLVVEHYYKPLLTAVKDISSSGSAPAAKFHNLSRLEVVFDAHVTASHEGEPIIGIGIKCADELGEALIHGARLEKKQPGLINHVAHVLLFDDAFPMFSDFAKSAKIPRNMTISLSFDQDHAKIVVLPRESDDVRDTEKFTRRLTKLIQTDDSRLVRLESQVASCLSTFIKWAQTEVEEDSKRAKSIEEILEI